MPQSANDKWRIDWAPNENQNIRTLPELEGLLSRIDQSHQRDPILIDIISLETEAVLTIGLGTDWGIANFTSKARLGLSSSAVEEDSKQEAETLVNRKTPGSAPRRRSSGEPMI